MSKSVEIIEKFVSEISEIILGIIVAKDIANRFFRNVKQNDEKCWEFQPAYRPFIRKISEE